MEPHELGAWKADWVWGLPIIVLNAMVHVLGLGLINENVVRKLENVMDRRHYTVRFAMAMSVTILLVTGLHALEAGLWAAAYVALGALPDLKPAMLYSLSALTSFGHANVFLAPHWQMMGALEALNGMLLF